MIELLASSSEAECTISSGIRSISSGALDKAEKVWLEAAGKRCLVYSACTTRVKLPRSSAVPAAGSCDCLVWEMVDLTAVLLQTAQSTVAVRAVGFALSSAHAQRLKSPTTSRQTVQLHVFAASK